MSFWELFLLCSGCATKAGRKKLQKYHNGACALLYAVLGFWVLRRNRMTRSACLLGYSA